MEVSTGVYKHFKGKYVYVLFTAKHSDRDEIEVVYKGLNDGGYFARPYESFVEQVQDKNGNWVSRFSKASEIEILEMIKNKTIKGDEVIKLDEFCK